MKKRTPKVKLQDMLDSIAAIKTYLGTMTEDELRHDIMIQDAILRRLEIIGEAAYQLGDSWRATHPEINWVDAMAMRNRLIHGYFIVELPVVWDTIHNDLPMLEQQLRDILQRLPPQA